MNIGGVVGTYVETYAITSSVTDTKTPITRDDIQIKSTSYTPFFKLKVNVSGTFSINGRLSVIQSDTDKWYGYAQLYKNNVPIHEEMSRYSRTGGGSLRHSFTVVPGDIIELRGKIQSGAPTYAYINCRDVFMNFNVSNNPFFEKL